MKTFVKIFAVVLAVLMLGSVMVACDKGGNDADTAAETTAETTASISVNIIVRDASGDKVYEETVTSTKNTLGEVLGIFCAQIDFEEEPFDSNDMLAKLGTVAPAAGETFIAYDETQGKDKAFDSIKNQVVTDGQTIIIAVIKL